MTTRGAMSEASTAPTPGAPGRGTVAPDASFATRPVPALDDSPSAGLSLAIAALQRHLDADAVGPSAPGQADPERSAHLAAALAGLQKMYAASFGGLDQRSVDGAASVGADQHGRGHIQRVCRYSMMLTARVAPGHINDPQFEYGFLLHDIGELVVPGRVLANPGALTDSEWEVVKQHPAAGRALLAEFPFLAGASEIVYAHHERWNGTGYPRGLVGDEIPIGARILALCDAFNAITQDRRYRKASTIADARGEIHRGGGKQFWPEAVNAFLNLGESELAAVRDLRSSGASIGARPTPRSSTGSLGPLEQPVPQPVGWLARALAKRRA